VALFNGNYPKGFVYKASALQDGGKQVNVGLGDYDANSGAFLRLRMTAVPGHLPSCGDTTMQWNAYATISGEGTIYAPITVTYSAPACPPKS
jgi:hypothetical protein